MPRIAFGQLLRGRCRHQRCKRRRRGVADDPRSFHHLRIAAVAGGVGDGAGAALLVQRDAADNATYQHVAAGDPHGAGQRARKPLRATLHETAAAQQITSLRHRKEDPPQRGGVVVIIGEIGRQRAFDRFVVAENPVELLRQRQPPVADGGKEFYQGADGLARVSKGVPALRERTDGGGEALHLSEQLVDSGAGLREALGQGAPRRIEIVRKHKGPAKRTAAGFVKIAGRNPFHGVDHAGPRQHAVFGIARIVGVAGFVQRTFDEQVAGFVARRCATHRVAALDDQHLAARACQNRAGRQASKAGADHHYVIARH